MNLKVHCQQLKKLKRGWQKIEILYFSLVGYRKNITLWVVVITKASLIKQIRNLIAKHKPINLQVKVR